MRLFDKILVANRGEIALRVIRTCRELGIRTVAVYSQADAGSPHAVAADEACPIGPAPARESYLRGDALLSVARRTGCQAVHPGYGFLSENAAFARAVGDAGLKFIGPPPEAIQAMGDKLAARRQAESVGAPIVPGSPKGVATEEEAIRLGERVGYPLLVKAAAGGGGKGMRVARKPEDLAAAVRQARSEAAASFADGTVYLERYLARPRHVEIQVLAESAGRRTISLGERDCSIQRRHQKVIEESPSPALDSRLRREMGEAAVAITSSVSYEGAGTVEFMLDEDGRFYFLEMNTRLQVEHPVTELVTGLDLVAEQIRIAAGAAISLPDRATQPRGAALECRIYAEDPYQGFIPCPGRIEDLREPAGPYVRLDSGVAKGMEVTTYYDPMIAKLAVWGRTREEALGRMRRALSEYLVVGIQTNIPFHFYCLSNERFVAGDYSIRFIEEEYDPSRLEKPDRDAAAAIACVLARMGVRSRPHPPRQESSGWKMSGRLARRTP